MPQIPTSFRLAGAGVLAALVYWLLYLAGLPGAFILDDAPNLNGLRAIEGGQVSELISFSLQGIAGPSGRPLSLFSFALQHESWPDTPGAFKQVNMLIHLLNAGLLLWLFSAIRRLSGASDEYRWVPMAAAALWLIWPIHVSTVLYVVQRMTLLSATCMLLGLLMHVKARSLQSEDAAPLARHLLFLMALFTGTVLGILAKENAIVFPLLVLALEATLLNRTRAPLPRLWRWLLWLPIIAFLVYLLFYYQPWTRFGRRDFDLYERVLTQGRILWMYVQQIVLPSAGSLRFFYDNYPVSTSPWSPITTAIAWLGWITAGIGAWRLRKAWPVPAFAVLFFLASHALESTVMPLELVFEHRSYLGSAALALALAWGVANAARYRRGLALGAGALYLLLMMAVTYNLTALWGNPQIQHRVWQQQNPDSARAQLHHAASLSMAGHTREAAQALEAGMIHFPDHPVFALARVELGCFQSALRPDSLQPALDAVHSGTGSILGGFAYLDRLTVAFSENHCDVYTAQELIPLIQAARGNRAFRRQRADLHLMEGIVCNRQGEIDCAREQLHAALELAPRPKLLVQAANWELENGNIGQARRHLDQLQALKQESPHAYLGLRRDILELQARLEDARAQAQP